MALALLCSLLLAAGCANPTPVSPPASSTANPPSTLDDAVGDLVDVDGRPVDTPAYVDMRNLAAAIDGRTLRLTLTLAAAMPAAPSPSVEHLLYRLAVHTGENAVPERDDPRVGVGYMIELVNRAAGDYYPWLVDWTGPAGPVWHGGSSLPGTAVAAGDTVTVSVPLAALGSPDLIRVGAWTGRFEPGPAGRLTAQDFLPAAEALDWLTLRP